MVEHELQKPRFREDIVMRQVDDDLILYDPVNDRVVLLNPSAVAVLELCDGSRSAGQIAEEIVEAIGVEIELARTNVETALHEFRTSGILHGPDASVA